MTTLGSLLLQSGTLGIAEYEAALRRQSLHGGDLGTSLLELGWLQEHELLALLAARYGIDAGPPGRLLDPDDALLAVCPMKLARRHAVFPIAASDEEIELAAAAPLHADSEQELAGATARRPRVVLVTAARLQQALRASAGVAADERLDRLALQLDAVETARVDDAAYLGAADEAADAGLAVEDAHGLLEIAGEDPLPADGPGYRRMAEAGAGVIVARRQASRLRVLDRRPPERSRRPSEPPPSSERPPSSSEQPSGSAEQPSGSVEQPSGSVEQPSSPSSLPPGPTEPLPGSEPPPISSPEAQLLAETVAARQPSAPPAADREPLSLPPVADMVGPRVTEVPLAFDGGARATAEVELAADSVPVSLRRELSAAEPPPTMFPRTGFRHRGPFTHEQALEAIAAAADARTLLEILMRYVRQYFGRLVLFVVHGQGTGAEARLVHGVPSEVASLHLELQDSGRLSTAAQGGELFVGTLRPSGADAVLATALALEPDERITLVPVQVRGRVVALLYGEDFDDQDGTNCLREATEVAAEVGVATAALIVKRKRPG